MTSRAISAASLGKRYRIGAGLARPRTLKEALSSALGAPRRNWDRVRRLSTFRDGDDRDVIWALRDVSLEVGHGEVVGIVGGNGAGKSTLLKILSRITRPTSGRARVVGRVGSLLEVGTGFHPELTGRDNIYLNGSILGMRRSDIARRFDEIVDFAGVGPFIDTPVKRYSSGMYLRLAFSIAAHLEPDVLIVDEVLAVGDLEFQRKCLQRMDQVGREGRTILFVSHNLGVVQRLCGRAVLLDKGRLVADGDATEIVRRYLASHDTTAAPGEWIDLSTAERTGSGVAQFAAVCYSSGDPSTGFWLYPSGPLELRVRIHSTTDLPRVSMSFLVRDDLGTKLINADSGEIGVTARLRPGTSEWLFRVSQLFLKPGRYYLDLWLADTYGTDCDHLRRAVPLEVLDPRRRSLGTFVEQRHGGVVVCDFHVRQVADEAGLSSRPARGLPSPLLRGSDA